MMSEQQVTVYDRVGGIEVDLEISNVEKYFLGHEYLTRGSRYA